MTHLFDLHCDTLYALHQNPDAGDLYANTLHVDIQRMEQVAPITSCFALFVDIEESPSPWQAAKDLYELFCCSMKRYSENIKQITYPDESFPISAMLSVEEGQILEGDLTRLTTLREWGVRLASLTWNYENDLGYPHTMAEYGLKDLGIEAISEMERLGIVVDVSHLSDEGFQSVVTHATKPFVASHSNSRFCTPVSRNLSDRRIRQLADAGGVMGLNFCPSFLSEGAEESHLEDILRHAQHIRRVGGSAVLALGTDFDGITGTLALPDISHMSKLWDALIKSGFSQHEVEGIWANNALRVLRA